MKKVSFDFDNTLTRLEVQVYAKELVERGLDIWVTTSRYATDPGGKDKWNNDLFKIIDKLKIPRVNVIFCEMIEKSKLISDKNFIWHLDDDSIELESINNHTMCVGIYVEDSFIWKKKCEKLL